MTDDPDPTPDDGADTLADEPTLPETEWPVDEKYLVLPADAEEVPVVASSNGGSAAAPTTVAPVVPSRTPPGAGPVRRRLPVPDDLGPALLLALVAALLAIAGAAFLATGGGEEATGEPPPATTPPTTTEEQTTTEPTARRVAVPSVVGMELEEARAALTAAGLEVTVARAPADEPEGRVVDQEPRAETEVERRTAVALTVSAGEPRIEVPDVVGASLADARQALREAGLRSRFRRVSSTEPAGTVVGQDPAAGEEVERSATVTLEVARERPEATTVEVPDVRGLSAADARARLRAAGLRASVVEVESDEPRRTVVGQSPRAGREVREGSTVTLRVSTGPTHVSVQDVTGLDEESARSQLAAAGFQVRIVDQPVGDPAQDGVVLSQTPAGGARVEKGSTVTLTVGRLA